MLTLKWSQASNSLKDRSRSVEEAFIPFPLFTLALAAFAIGTSEFVIVGILPNLSYDLHVGIPSAGLLVTGYALGVVIGAPILAIATARAPRKELLLSLIATYAVGNALCALAPTYALLMGARLLTALCHGTFFGVGSIVAAQLVQPDKRGQAIAIMFSGLTLANVLGVPAGTALGQVAGWRATFWCIVALALAAAVAIALLLPRQPRPTSSGLIAEFAVIRKPQVLLALLMSGLLTASLFSVFTFVTPILERVAHLSPIGVTWLLLLFGVGTTVGNLIGGRLGDWRLMPSVAAVQLAIIVILALFTVTLPHTVPAAITLVSWGLLAFTIATPLQMRVTDTAPSAPNLVATLNQGAFNLGSASGAWFGSVVLGAGLSYQSLPWLGALLGAFGLGATALSMILDHRAKTSALLITPS